LAAPPEGLSSFSKLVIIIIVTTTTTEEEEQQTFQLHEWKNFFIIFCINISVLPNTSSGNRNSGKQSQEIRAHARRKRVCTCHSLRNSREEGYTVMKRAFRLQIAHKQTQNCSEINDIGGQAVL
jgi:hypothetical protein